MLPIFIREYSPEKKFLSSLHVSLFKGQLSRKIFRSKYSLLHPVEFSVLGVCVTFDWGLHGARLSCQHAFHQGLKFISYFLMVV